MGPGIRPLSYLILARRGAEVRVHALKQAVRSRLHQIQNQLEAGIVSVVGVRNFPVLQLWCEIHEQTDLVPMLGRTVAQHDRKVAAVHRQEMVEATVVLRPQSAGAEPGQVICASCRNRQRSRIRTITDVIPVGTG